MISSDSIRSLVAGLLRLARSRAFELGGTAVSLILLAVLLREALSDTDSLEISPIPAVASAALFGLSWLTLSFAWTILVSGRLDTDGSRRWLRSQLLRYVPGGVWAPISRFVDMEGDTRSRAKLLALETSAILSGALFVGSVAASWALSPWWMCGIPVALAGLLATTRFAPGSPAARAAWACAVVAALCMYLGASGLAQHAVGPDVSFWSAAAAGVLSWLAGYVVIFAPSGVGAKEWAYVGLLGASSRSSVAAGVLAARVLFIVGELAVLAGAASAQRRSARLANQEVGRDQFAAPEV